MTRSRALAVTLLAILTTAAVPAAPPNHAAEVEGFLRTMQGAVATYGTGQREAAVEAVGDAFFAFEESDFHRALALRDKSLYKRIEGAWLDVRARMAGGASGEEVARSLAAWQALLDEAKRTVAGEAGSEAGPFFNGFLILLREGFEAMLVISALAAYLRRTEHSDRVRDLYLGAGLALGASLLLWLAARTVLTISGAGQEVIEGVTMLVATVVLFTVSYWLLSKVQAQAWQQFITRKIKDSVSRGGRFGLVLLAFVVVFREGFETVLFYEALLAGSGAGSGPVILGGAALAGVLLAVLYVFVVRAGRRIPLRAFFGVTGGLLYVLAFKFLGDGLRELQEGGVLGVTPADFVPQLSLLQDWLGVHPTVETLLGQALLLAAALVALAVTVRSLAAGRSAAAEQPV